jgi:hypothetical protein
MERHIQILRRNCLEVLSDCLLRVGVVVTAELREYRSYLVCGKVGASAKCHVLLRVRHARETGRRLVAADEIILLNRNYRR